MRPSSPAAQRTQLRGDLRRERLLRAAGELVIQRPLGAVTYAAVCARARVPTGSSYHFYPDLDAIYRALVERDRAGMDAALMRPLNAAQRSTWQAVVGCLVERAARYNRAHPVAAKLVLGGQAPPDLKRMDRESDRVRSGLALQVLEQLFVVPHIPRKRRVAFLATEIVDTVFTVSMTESGRLGASYVRLAKSAAIGFLAQFFGDRLPPRPRPTGVRPVRRSGSLR